MLNVKADFFFVVLFSTVKKDMKDEADDRMQQFKKKAKELRILDSKTAQNLCMCCGFFFLLLFHSFNTLAIRPAASYLTLKNQNWNSLML